MKKESIMKVLIRQRDDLVKAGRALRKLEFYVDDFEKSKEIQERQDKVYKKYLFVEGLIGALNEKDRVQEETKRIK